MIYLFPASQETRNLASSPAVSATHLSRRQRASRSANGLSFPNFDPKPTSPLNPFINPEKLNRVPAATGYVFDAVLHQATSLRLPFSLDKPFSRHRR